MYYINIIRGKPLKWSIVWRCQVRRLLLKLLTLYELNMTSMESFLQILPIQIRNGGCNTLLWKLYEYIILIRKLINKKWNKKKKKSLNSKRETHLLKVPLSEAATWDVLASQPTGHCFAGLRLHRSQKCIGITKSVFNYNCTLNCTIFSEKCLHNVEIWCSVWTFVEGSLLNWVLRSTLMSYGSDI